MYKVILGDMTVGGSTAIFVSTDNWNGVEIASFDTEKEAKEYITEFLKYDEYDQYCRF